MPLTLIPISHGTLCHGSRWTVSDEDDLASKVARLALGQTRHVAAILKGIRDLESGLRMNELIPEAGGLLEAHQQRFPELDIDGAVERIAWEEARHFRVAVTADIAHDNDDARAALFKGFDEVAPGLASRRQAETIAIPKLRDWMKAFSAKAIKQIEAWRDDV